MTNQVTLAFALDSGKILKHGELKSILTWMETTDAPKTYGEIVVVTLPHSFPVIRLNKAIETSNIDDLEILNIRNSKEIVIGSFGEDENINNSEV